MSSDFDAFADDVDAHAIGSAYNAHDDRPALLDLLGRLDGMHVLDAGCGSGLYAEELLTRGARVTGVDGSGRLIALAHARLGPRADLRTHDLTEPLAWVPDNTVDRVVLALVLHHLPDPITTSHELRRVLTDDGRLVVSTVHPHAPRRVRPLERRTGVHRVPARRGRAVTATG